MVGLAESTTGVRPPTAYDRFDTTKRNSWLDGLQAKIARGINPPLEPGPSRSPSPFVPPENFLHQQAELDDDDLEYANVFGGPAWDGSAAAGGLDAPQDDQTLGFPSNGFAPSAADQAYDEGDIISDHPVDSAGMLQDLGAPPIQPQPDMPQMFDPFAGVTQEPPAFDSTLYDRFLYPALPTHTTAYPALQHEYMDANYLQAFAQQAMAPGLQTDAQDPDMTQVQVPGGDSFLDTYFNMDGGIEGPGHLDHTEGDVTEQSGIQSATGFTEGEVFEVDDDELVPDDSATQYENSEASGDRAVPIQDSQGAEWDDEGDNVEGYEEEGYSTDEPAEGGSDDDRFEGRSRTGESYEDNEEEHHEPDSPARRDDAQRRAARRMKVYEEEDELDDEEYDEDQLDLSDGAREAAEDEDEEEEEEEEEDEDEDDDEDEDEQEEESEEEPRPAQVKRKWNNSDAPIELSSDDDEAPGATAESSRPTTRPRYSSGSERDPDEHVEDADFDEDEMVENPHAHSAGSDHRSDSYEAAADDAGVSSPPQSPGDDHLPSEADEDQGHQGDVEDDDDEGDIAEGAYGDSDSDEEMEGKDGPGVVETVSPPGTPKFSGDRSDAAPNSSSPAAASAVPLAAATVSAVPGASAPVQMASTPAPAPAVQAGPSSHIAAPASGPIIIDVTDTDPDSESASDEEDERLDDADETGGGAEAAGSSSPAVAPTPHSAILDLTGSDDDSDEAQSADEVEVPRLPSQSRRTAMLSGSQERSEGEGPGEEKDQDQQGNDDSSSSSSGSESDDSEAQSRASSAGEASDATRDELASDDDGEVVIGEASGAADSEARAEDLEPIDVAPSTAASLPITGADARERSGSAPIASQSHEIIDVDDDSEDGDVGAAGPSSVQDGEVVAAIVDEVDIDMLGDSTAAVLDMPVATRPDIVETPGLGEVPPNIIDVLDVQETEEEVIEEPSDETSPAHVVVSEEDVAIDQVGAQPLAERSVNTLDTPTIEVTDMIHQPDADIAHHAPHVDDALHAPASTAAPATISIPTGDEEEAQITASTGLPASPVREAEDVPHTDMTFQPDAEIIHHAPHADDILHSPATSTANPLLSMPTDEEEEKQLAAAVGEAGHGGMDIDIAEPVITVDDLPDPMAPPPATQLENPIKAGELPVDSNNSSVGVEPPANLPIITIDSRPPSRAESPILLPDPRAPPADAHMPSPLLSDMPLRDCQATRSPSVIAQAPDEDPVLPTPIEGMFRASPSPELPDPTEPAEDARLPMPDVPVAERPSSPSLVAQAPDIIAQENAEAVAGEEVLQASQGSPARRSVSDLETLPGPFAALIDDAAEGTAGLEDVDADANMRSVDGDNVEAEDEVTDEATQAEEGETTAGTSDEVVARDFGSDAAGPSMGLAIPEITEVLATPASERDVELALDTALTTRENTPYVPLLHRHGHGAGVAPSPRRARRSLTPSGEPPVTRSHCDYHKIRLSTETQDGTFLAPQCVLGDVDRIAAEGVEDMGKASKEEEKAAKKNVVSHNHTEIGPELAAKLHRVAGAGIFDEGHLYLLGVEQLQPAVAEDDPVAEPEADDELEEVADLPEGPPEAEIDGADGTAEDDTDEDADNVQVDIQAVPAGNTRSKTSSVEPGLGMTEPIVGERGSTREPSEAKDSVGDAIDSTQPAPRRSSRLSRSVEPAAHDVAAGGARASTHRGTRSAALSEKPIAEASGSQSMHRTASVTSQATIPEEPAQEHQAESAWTVKPRRSMRRKGKEIAEEGESAADAAGAQAEEEAQESDLASPRTPARRKPQSHDAGASTRRVSTRTRQDDMPYRPQTPEADAGRDGNDTESLITPSPRKPRSTRKPVSRSTPVVELPTRSPTAAAPASTLAATRDEDTEDMPAASAGAEAVDTPPATRTRKRKHRLSAAGEGEAEGDGDEGKATPSKTKRRAVSKNGEAEEEPTVTPDKRTTRSEAKQAEEKPRGFLSRLFWRK